MRLINLIMRSHAAGIIAVVWSDELLDEFRRVLTDKKGVDPGRAAEIAARVADWAPEGRLDPALYSLAVPTMSGPDTADHVHAAAAAVGADVLLTDNVRDFATEDLGRCRVLTPADLFAELAIEHAPMFLRVLFETSRQPHHHSGHRLSCSMICVPSG